MIKLTKKQILFLHEDLIKEFGGLNGVRDENLLESAISAPFQGFDKKDFYPSVPEKAARLGYGIIKNHPFVDGNKRVGTHSMIVFLKLNNFNLEYDDAELIDIISRVADSSASYEELLGWLKGHLK